MLGLLLLYWIGKYHYRLAGEYDKSQWGFTILGIVTYYAGTFVFGLILGTAVEIISPGYWDNFNEMLFSLLMLPFGILSTYLWYKYLENSWKNNKTDPLINSNELEENSETI
jgi:membrane protein DedA with SNARE-associated domain